MNHGWRVDRKGGSVDVERAEFWLLALYYLLYILHRV